jgi:hypothetical protein
MTRPCKFVKTVPLKNREQLSVKDRAEIDSYS